MYNRFMKILEGIREDKKLLPCPPDFGWYWGGGVWVNPLKTIILIFTMLHLKKKIKKNTCRYHYFTPVYQKSW